MTSESHLERAGAGSPLPSRTYIKLNMIQSCWQQGYELWPDGDTFVTSQDPRVQRRGALPAFEARARPVGDSPCRPRPDNQSSSVDEAAFPPRHCPCVKPEARCSARAPKARSADRDLLPTISFS